jgi:hypothetical protein
VVALELIPPYVGDVKLQQCRVKLPPLIVFEWYRRAKNNSWLFTIEHPLMDSLITSLPPESKELADLATPVLRMAAFKYLLQQNDCLLEEIIPFDDDGDNAPRNDKLFEWRKLRVQVGVNQGGTKDVGPALLVCWFVSECTI